jgi:predicted transcriptional regulator of viral defense system
MEENISQKVRDRVTRFKKGDLFTVRDFEDLNNDSLVTRTLSRLQNEGIIVRVATGIYMNPLVHQE